MREKRIIDGVESYQCTTCYEWKPIGKFYRLSKNQLTSRCGRRSECATCDNARRVVTRKAVLA